MNMYTIGIDIGGTNIKLGLVDDKDEIIERSRLNTKNFKRNKTKLIDALCQSVVDLIAKKNLKKKQILGIGMGWPGFIDPKEGLVHTLPNIPGWRNVAVSKIIKSELRLPVFIDNDVNLITLAEWKKGAGQGCNDLICITLGTGVGSGLVLDDRLYRGHNYVAGEIGHIPYQDKTLELFVGNKVLLARAMETFDDKDIRIEDVFALAQRGDEKAIHFWDQAGEHIGFVLAGIVNLLNPEKVIFGGGVSNNFKFLGPAIKATVQKKAIEVASSSVKIVRAKLGDDAGILGAHFLVKDSLVER